ncbi:MBL fold metallo-hydrolase [Chitinophaga rhizophila]|uniref:MBL fold metallo-hydrolase n=1 Tax=Chitinophaga rhizophila TaxID=2866212 RepID=A0ABS7G4Z3_9BACT|nr:MBL fold metallo-hydrolase [Chitinophaga rhizophila]MBW8682718.1 MBL fold metallo-hydrolase [Chitinophaga rhizophila]
MSLQITSLNSGSNGNCYYIGNATDAVLIDAGISCRETERRMKRLGLKMDIVKAIFISHEHSDHIRGLEVLSKKYCLPVYITPKTMLHGRLALNELYVKVFDAMTPVAIGGLTIHAFSKAHDAIEPHSFMICHNDIRIGVFTDIGIPCSNLISHFQQCHAAFLEANYDEQMLEQGRYPYFLKKRIRGGRGHLSNAQALEVFKKHKPAFMTHLLLSHLSRDNNKPELVLDLFRPHAGRTQVVVASRDVETAIYHISAVPQTVIPKIDYIQGQLAF